MGEQKLSAVDLAFKAMVSIDAMRERETMARAREDVRVIARLFDIGDPESLWRAACERWYAIARAACERWYAVAREAYARDDS